MADILKIARDFNPKKALTHIFDKIDEIIGRLNILWRNDGNAKVYKALLTQTGTDAPTATVSVNTLSNSPTITRDSLGYYLIESADFIKGKTYVYIGSGSSSGTEVNACLVTSGTVEVSTFVYVSQSVGSSVGIQNVEGLGYLDDTPILIVVYP